LLISREKMAVGWMVLADIPGDVEGQGRLAMARPGRQDGQFTGVEARGQPVVVKKPRAQAVGLPVKVPLVKKVRYLI